MSPEIAPPRPVPSEDVAWTEWAEVPRFAMRYRHLSRAALGEGYHVGVAIEELGPGRQSSPAHYHALEEEHVFVLDGALTLRLGEESHAMTAGDYVCFPAGQRAGHCLVNDGTEPCRYVIVGERNPNDVVVYTDSNKVLVRSLGRRAIVDLAARRGYWDGEETGLARGEVPPSEDDAEPTAAPVRPRPPISSHDVAWDDEGDGPRFGGRSRHLTWAALGSGDCHLGVLIEAPAPGMRLAPRHYHMLEEEHALILDGQVTLLFGDECFELRPGDYVCFPAGQEIGHSFMNGGTGPCSYLMIGERNPSDVCVYPDSNKMAVKAVAMKGATFDMAGVRAYWDGETTG